MISDNKQDNFSQNPIKDAVNTINKQLSKQNLLYENSANKLKKESNQQEAEIERYKNDTRLKKHLTYFVMWFTSLWSVAIISLIAFKNNLSDFVYFTYMTETLGIVLGLPSIVIWHFFPRK